ncbi:hypothetical protein ACDZ28_09075 [Paenibacillus sp. RS8]|uniref:Uncharacterized protein n=1 Tax=Paenibacillus odorifer TaxID=189426 RepID=A0A1R0Y9H7_9BACL|nr:hypothetical protein [Paenibacillus odorifer]OMD44020.1 hypothetical protein BSK52_00265 [Paenibacillus odorifer]
MIRVTFNETDGFLAKGLQPKEISELGKAALERFDYDSSNYFTIVRKGNKDKLIVTDGNYEEVDYSPISLKQDLNEDFWIIVDNYGLNSPEGIIINFLLPREY